jgi:hypothetical protein
LVFAVAVFRGRPTGLSIVVAIEFLSSRSRLIVVSYCPLGKSCSTLPAGGEIGRERFFADPAQFSGKRPLYVSGEKA